MYAIKRKEERERKWEEIKKSKNMGEFWKSTNTVRAKKKGGMKGGKISKKRWKEHFEKLLGVEKETDQVRNRIRDDSEENVENEELNSDITFEELGKIIIKIKRGKAV